MKLIHFNGKQYKQDSLALQASMASVKLSLSDLQKEGDVKENVDKIPAITLGAVVKHDNSFYILIPSMTNTYGLLSKQMLKKALNVEYEEVHIQSTNSYHHEKTYSQRRPSSRGRRDGHNAKRSWE